NGAKVSKIKCFQFAQQTLFKKRKLKFVFHLENSIVSYYVKREEDSSPSLKYGFSIYLLIIIAS
ncbi:hypothetical protein DW812_06285, partial [Mediterraneibacter gnavus]